MTLTDACSIARSFYGSFEKLNINALLWLCYPFWY